MATVARNLQAENFLDTLRVGASINGGARKEDVETETERKAESYALFHVVTKKKVAGFFLFFKPRRTEVVRKENSCKGRTKRISNYVKRDRTRRVT